MRRIIFITMLSAGLCGQGCATELLAERGILLAVSPDSRYIVYFVANTEVPDEYVDGHVWIYDVASKVHSLLSEESYLQNYIAVAWPGKGHYFYLADGEMLFRYSFFEARKDVLFRCAENQVLLGFAVSDDDRFAAVNVLSSDSMHINQIVEALDLKTNSIDSVYQVADSSLGEDLRNHVLFGSSGGSLYVRNLYGELLEANLTKKSVSTLTVGVDELYFVREPYLYFTSGDGDTTVLQEYDVTTRSSFAFMRGSSMNVVFVGPYGDDIAVGLTDNAFIYNKEGTVRSLLTDDLKPYSSVFISDRFLIQRDGSRLYLVELP